METQLELSPICILFPVNALCYFYYAVGIFYLELCVQEALRATMAGAGDKACTTPNITTAMSSDGYNPMNAVRQVPYQHTNSAIF